MLVPLTHSQAGGTTILILYMRSTDKTKKVKHIEKCICHFYAQGLSKLEFFAIVGLLLWTLREILRKFAPPSFRKHRHTQLGIEDVSWNLCESGRAEAWTRLSAMFLGSALATGEFICSVFFHIYFNKGFGFILVWNKMVFKYECFAKWKLNPCFLIYQKYIHHSLVKKKKICLKQ